jgi:hypothetical protein
MNITVDKYDLGENTSQELTKTPDPRRFQTQTARKLTRTVCVSGEYEAS